MLGTAGLGPVGLLLAGFAASLWRRRVLDHLLCAVTQPAGVWARLRLLVAMAASLQEQGANDAQRAAAAVPPL